MITNKNLQEQNLYLKRQIKVLANKIDEIEYIAKSAKIKVDRVLGLYAIALSICKQNKNLNIDRTKEEITIQLIKENKPYDTYVATRMEQNEGETNE